MMKRNGKKIAAGAVLAGAACMAVGFSVAAAKQEAHVVRGEYDFSNMTVRRVWFNAEDPVFMIDDYDRIWTDENVNAVGTGSGKTYEKLMAPMKEMFRQIGGVYTEDGDKIAITMNGDTLEMTVGSRDVIFNGVKESGVLESGQEPKKVNVQDTDYNTYLDEAYEVVYLPVYYVLEKFQAQLANDSSVASLYAAIPIFNGEQVPSLKTAAEGCGIRFDSLLNKTAEYSDMVVQNLAEIQNEDGGFALLPDNTDMEQEELASHRGTLVGDSTLEKGATVSILSYLADAVAENGSDDAQEVLKKGVSYLLSYQNPCGGWQMNPSDPKGFRGNVVFTDHATTDVLRLLRRVLSDESLSEVKAAAGEDALKKAVEKGDSFILASQLTFDGVLSGWASQYTEDGKMTMGRTYERESVSAIETADIVDYLMDNYTKDQENIKLAVDAATDWLANVKIEDKEAVVIQDYTMQNGYDIFLMGDDEPGVEDTSYADDGLGTWAANYKYENGVFKPLYSDVDPKRPDQKYVNDWNASKSNDLIWYATRTEVTYYDNDLADQLLENYESWENGEKPEEPDTPEKPDTPEEPNTPEEPDHGGSGSSSGSGGGRHSISTSVVRTEQLDGRWEDTDYGRTFVRNNGTRVRSVWGQLPDAWYYFDIDGYACKGWQLIGGFWYYLDPATYVMYTGWLDMGAGKYYLDPATGAMRTGWVSIDGKWYYFNPVSSNGEAGKKPLGELYQNTVTPDGFTVDENGVWIQ